MTIDERLDALTARHEALTMNVELMSRNLADLVGAHEEMQQDIKIMLRSQVVMSESLDKLTKRVTEIADVQIQADRRIAALIGIVDEIIRGRNGGPKA